jgi:sigma-B regulation protein RsbU (phosphoserine phosphatase)
VILLGTDGVWEMPDAKGEQFGKDRMRAVIRQSAAQPAEGIAQSLRDQLAAFRGEHRPADDVTFVIVKVTAVAPPAGGPST